MTFALGRFARSLARTVSAPVRWLALHLVYWTSEKWQHAGLEVADLTRGGSSPEARAKVGDAVDVLAHVDARRFRRLRSDVKRIGVTDIGGAGAGQYWHQLKACVLDSGYAIRTPAPVVAMTLVHEATHARIRRMGVRITPRTLDRIERICTRAELEFAVRSGNQDALRIARRKLSAEPWKSVTPETVVRRQLTELGWPAWATKLHRQLFRE